MGEARELEDARRCLERNIWRVSTSAPGQKATSVCPTQCPHCRQKLPLDANKDADVLSSNVDTADSDAWKRHRRLSFDKMALPSKP